MTIATCRGTAAGRSIGSITARLRRGRCSDATRASDGHDLGFLRRGEAIDFADRAVGEALQVVERAALFVLGNLLVLAQASGMVVGVAAQVADRDLRVFARVPHDLGQLAPTLLGEGRHRHAQQIALPIFAPMPFSQGWTLIVRASRSVTLATWLTGRSDP